VTVHEVFRADARRIAADRKAGVLKVNAVHEDVPFTKELTAAVNEEINDLARWLGLDLIR
jgi:uncharacterized protein YcaQ